MEDFSTLWRFNPSENTTGIFFSSPFNLIDKTLNSTWEANQEVQLRTVRKWGGLTLSAETENYKAIASLVASPQDWVFSLEKHFLNTCYWMKLQSLNYKNNSE